MAWTYSEPSTFREGTIITQNADELVAANWGSYGIPLFFLIDHPDFVTLRIDHENLPSWADPAEVIGYLCTDRSDYEGSDGVPYRYKTRFSTSQATTIYLNGDDNYILVFRPVSSDTTGFARCYVELSEPQIPETFSASVSGTLQNNIAISVYGLSSRRIHYYLKPIDPTGDEVEFITTLDFHVFEDLSDGTYRVWVAYEDGYRPTGELRLRSLRTAGGSDNVDIQISASTTWSLHPGPGSEDLGTVSLPYTMPAFSGLAVKTLYRYKMQFNAAGTVRFYSSGGADLYGYVSDAVTQTTWDMSTGTPLTVMAKDDNSGTNLNFKIECYCQANHAYYIWFKNKDGTAYSGSVTITFERAATGWTYNDNYQSHSIVSARTTQSIKLEEYTGGRFMVSFAGSGTAHFESSRSDAVVYITDGLYGFDTSTGVPYTQSGGSASGQQYNTYTVEASTDSSNPIWYYVWVKGTTSSNTNTITVTITPPAAVGQWTEVAMDVIAVGEDTVSKDFIIDVRHTYRYEVSFNTSGTAHFYSEGTINVVAYIGGSNNGIDPSNGVPVSKYEAWGTATLNYDATYGVTAGTKYYVYVKGKDGGVSGSITIYFTPTQWTETYVGDGNLDDTEWPQTRHIDAFHTYRYNLTFAKDGKVRLWSTGSTDVVAYMGVQNSGINPSDGIPRSFNGSWDNISSTDLNFDGEYDVTAGTVYYFYVKGKNWKTAGDSWFTLRPIPEGTSGDRGFWIVVIRAGTAAWVKLTTYINVTSGWTEIKGYVNTSSGWQDKY